MKRLREILLVAATSLVLHACAPEPPAPAPVKPVPGECVVHLELVGMSNPDRCPTTIAGALHDLDGIRHVTIGYMERMGWIRAVEGSACDESSAERLVKAVRRAGYDGRVRRIALPGGSP